ncbi:MAG: SCO family protein [Myxococcales bacterium]|nr:SCO family protein [Myxococcales bacterium]
MQAESGTSERRPSDRPPIPWWRSPWVVAGIVGFITIPILRVYLRHIPEPPKKMYQLPAFELLDQDGKPFTLERLKGHVTVVNFFFTSCQMICGKLTQQMGKLQAKYDAADVPIRLLSISVDPDTDRPAVLKAYMRRYGADPKRWTFVTSKPGERKKLVTLIIDGFKQAMGDKKPNGQGIIDIAHSARFAIVDRDGAIRGFYESTEIGLDEIFHRSRHVLRPPKR